MKEGVWRIDGLKVETRNTRTESCPIATWFNTDLTWNGLSLRCDRPRNNRLSHIDVGTIHVRLSTYRNIDTKQVASSGTASDFSSESDRLQCRDDTPKEASFASLSGLFSPLTANRTIRHLQPLYHVAGEPLNCFDYVAWAPSEPRNRLPDEDCVVLDRNQQWGVTRCSAKMPYVCELWPGGEQAADTATTITRCTALQNAGTLPSRGAPYPQKYSDRSVTLIINFNIAMTLTL
jgi:hypothetical protein